MGMKDRAGDRRGARGCGQDGRVGMEGVKKAAICVEDCQGVVVRAAEVSLCQQVSLELSFRVKRQNPAREGRKNKQLEEGNGKKRQEEENNSRSKNRRMLMHAQRPQRSATDKHLPNTPLHPQIPQSDLPIPRPRD